MSEKVITMRAYCMVAHAAVGLTPGSIGSIRLAALAQACVDQGLDFEEQLDKKVSEQPDTTEYLQSLEAMSPETFERDDGKFQVGELVFRDPVARDFLVSIPSTLASEYTTVVAVAARCAKIDLAEMLNKPVTEVFAGVDWVGKAQMA